jgi:Vitamin K-dependent gamma-carboxylase
MTLHAILAAWNDFWFSDQKLLPLAVFRIFFGFISFVTAILLLPWAGAWFGPHAILSMATLANQDATTRLGLFTLFPNSETWAYVLVAAMAILALFLSVGFKTRWTAFLLWLVMNSLHHRDPYLLNSGDTFMRQIAFWMMFAPSGKILSIDFFLNRKHEDSATAFDRTGPGWTIRALQLQMCLLYMEAFWSKVWGPIWWSGSAVYYTSRIEEFYHLPVLPYVFDHLWTCQLISFATLFIEFSLFTLIWIKEFRYWVLFLGMAQHLSIEWMMNIPIFEWLMISNYILFIDPQDLKKLFLSIGRKPLPEPLPDMRTDQQ